jgi:3-oxoadipate enol-lactonase
MAMSEPTVLCIHGFPLDHSMWRHQLAALSRWRCVAPDLRNTGTEFSMEAYARDLIQVLDELEIERAVMCGLSMGGYIIFELLRRFPERVHAAVLCNTKAAADTREARRSRDTLAARVQERGTGVLVDELVPKLLAGATRERQPAVVREVTEMVQRQPVAGVVGALRALRDRPDSTALLGKIRIPVLVIAGDDDQITPAAGMEEMASAIPGAQFVVIPQSGHLSPLEQPAAVTTALSDFLAQQ